MSNILTERQKDAEILGVSAEEFWEHMSPRVKKAKALVIDGVLRYTRAEIIEMDCTMFLYSLAQEYVDKHEEPESPLQLAVVHKYVPAGMR